MSFEIISVVVAILSYLLADDENEVSTFFLFVLMLNSICYVDSICFSR